MLRDEMDNEVSICCFYAVIRNCHTPFHFLVSLGLFASMRLSLEQSCKHQTGTQLKSEAVTRGLLPPHGQKASGRYCDGPEQLPAAASLTSDSKFSFLIPSDSFENSYFFSGERQANSSLVLSFPTDAENCPQDFDNFFQLFGSDFLLCPDKQLVHLKHPDLIFRIAQEQNDQ